jgi:hypothetical protein
MGRADEEIIEGVVPGFETMVLGGKEYAVREPSNRRARVIRRALVEMAEAAESMDDTDPKLWDAIDLCFDTCLKNFSPETEADWDHIAEHATDRERQKAMEAVQEAVAAPFATAPNREGRRAASKAPRKKSGTRGRRPTTSR